MDIENYLKNLKKDYTQTMPPVGFSERGWLSLKESLSAQDTPQFFLSFIPVQKFALAFASIIIVFGLFWGVTQAAQAALPGEPLYPVKRLSENILITISPDSQVKIDRRAQEIIDLTKKERNSKLLKRTVEDYHKEILKTRGGFAESEKNQEDFRQKLEEQERDFRGAIEEKPTSKENLEKAIEAAEEGQGSKSAEKEEVKGDDEKSKEEQEPQKTEGESSSNPDTEDSR